MFDGIWLKALTILSAILIATSVTMTALYLGKRDELAALSVKYTQSQSNLKEANESKAKIIEGNKQDDQTITQKEEKVKVIDNSVSKAKESLSKLPSKVKCPVEKLKGEAIEEVKYVNIDGPFDDEFIRVFDQYKRNTNPSTR